MCRLKVSCFRCFQTDQKKEIISDSEFVPTKDHLPASSYNWGQSKAAGQDDEFFSSILTKDNKKVITNYPSIRTSEFYSIAWKLKEGSRHQSGEGML